ncbi:MAG: DUF6440 family protein [Bacteroidales bacterium]|nr:DUF6440 family protein [Bacteroidales bacterium]
MYRDDTVDKDRFLIGARKGALKGFRVITDTKTGVQYLFIWDGYAGGLTVLVDKEGKPLIGK